MSHRTPFTPPSKLQNSVHQKLKKSLIKDCGCDVWLWFHMFRGSGFTFYAGSFFNATCTLGISINAMIAQGNQTSYNGDLTLFALMLIYIPNVLFTVIQLVHTRILYYFQKELEYMVKIEDLTEKIEKNEKPEKMQFYCQDRDKFAWRILKQKKKWGGYIPIITVTVLNAWGFFSNPNLIMSGGTDAIDYINIVLNYFVEIILSFCLMGFAMKMPFLSRFFVRVFDNIPKTTKGYLAFQYLHSLYTKELPNLALLIFGTILNVIGIFSGVLEFGKIFSPEEWYRGVFFWIPLLFTIVSQVTVTICMLIYPFVFCGIFGYSKFFKAISKNPTPNTTKTENIQQSETVQTIEVTENVPTTEVTTEINNE